MEFHHQLLLALSFAAFAIIHLVQAQPDQQGFISLDCGLPPTESPYTDSLTGLTFSSDANFIKGGKRGEGVDNSIYPYKQYKDFRYFPDGIRNCYDLTVTKGIKYLIRAGFSYGNYDGLNICLVKTGPTVPLISTLELRPLRNDSYSTQFGPLNLLYRRAYASNSRGYIRYPDDVFDRIWDRYNWFETDVNTTLSVTSTNPFQVPEAVSRSGISPRNATRPLWFFVSTGDSKANVYFHFAEIQTLNANDTREFDILIDDNIVQKAYSPKVLQSETKYNLSPQRCSFSSCYLELVKTQRSTLPPLINAIEAFSVLDFLYAETNPNDVTAMKSIQEFYGLNIISWQGDPCVPEILKWEDLKCSYTNKSTPPRIISLDLSSRGLKGLITPAFQNLTELQKLDLSNNSLTGGVPEFLASMKSLSILNLNWNNLTGPLPKVFQERQNNGLKLTVQGNQKMCVDASCKKSNQKYVLPVVASAASVLVIVAVLILIVLIFKKKRPMQGT